jgi:ankyrin repeat protein
MSDAVPLPANPNLEQYKKLAKDFQHACESKEAGAVRGWAKQWCEALARLEDLEPTPEGEKEINRNAARLEQRWKQFKEANGSSLSCNLTDCQFFIARAHGFASWPKFQNHLQALSRAHSPVTHFEAAADAIVSGDSAKLEKLLQEHPALVRARSTRAHRSTLLHYVSANGVEDFRQKTPKNVVEIAELLLAAGSNVNAESDAYGGRSTTLGLTATSCHPENAGVQIPLMQVLIDHGAFLDGSEGRSIVNLCLQNGRGQAADFLGSRGARLDLEGAAGVGRVDRVKNFFTKNGELKSPATRQQMEDGFAWACQFGRTAVAHFLLQQGLEVDTKLRHHGQTGLHWAAYGGYSETVKLLLERGSPIDATDDAFHGTPLDWALYQWGNATRPEIEADRYYETVALLDRAGARFDLRSQHDEGVRRACDSDPGMRLALQGETAKQSRS